MKLDSQERTAVDGLKSGQRGPLPGQSSRAFCTEPASFFPSSFHLNAHATIASWRDSNTP